jgi:hypothetical protein
MTQSVATVRPARVSAPVALISAIDDEPSVKVPLLRRWQPGIEPWRSERRTR